jgi:hypothetical protein
LEKSKLRNDKPKATSFNEGLDPPAKKSSELFERSKSLELPHSRRVKTPPPISTG